MQKIKNPNDIDTSSIGTSNDEANRLRNVIKNSYHEQWQKRKKERQLVEAIQIRSSGSRTTLIHTFEISSTMVPKGSTTATLGDIHLGDFFTFSV